jgi:hypothetical protein
MGERKLFQNADVIYCAESLDECWRLFEQDSDVVRADEESHDPFEEIPGDTPLELCFEDEPEEEPTRTQRQRGKYTFWFVSKLAREWAAEFGGSGHFSGGDC